MEKDLTVNIYEMFPENHTDEDVEKVLRKLGSPREIANKYSNTKKYLISPSIYDDYIKTLKITTLAAALFFLLSKALFGGLIIYLFANHSKIFGWFEIDANNSLNLMSQDC